MSGVFTRPIFIAGLLIAFLWPRYFYIGLANKGVSLFVVTTLLMVPVLLLALAVRPSIRLIVGAGIVRWLAVLLVLFLWLGWRLLADLQGVASAASVALLVEDLLTFVIWGLIAAVAFADERVSTRLPAIMAAVVFVSAVAAGLEVATQQPILQVLGLSGLQVGDANMLKALDFASQRGGENVRAKAVFTHPIIFGQVMAALFPFALHFLARRTALSALIGTTMIGACLFGIMACQSRSPLVLVVAASAFYLLLLTLDFRSPIRLLVFGAFAYLGVLVMPAASAGLEGLTAGRDAVEAKSSDVRSQQFQDGMAALEQRPLAGYGDGQSALYAGAVGRNNIRTIDSYYLSSAVDSGYVGVALLAVFFVMLALGSVTRTVKARTDRSLSAAVSAMSLSIVIGLSIISINDELTLLFIALGFQIAASGREVYNALART